MENEELILNAARQDGLFREVLDEAPAGACKFPLFVLEVGDEMEVDQSISPDHSRYDVTDVYTIVIAVHIVKNNRLAAKARVKALLKAFLGELADLITDGRHFELTEFDRRPSAIGGKNVILGRIELSRVDCFDLT